MSPTYSYTICLKAAVIHQGSGMDLFNFSAGALGLTAQNKTPLYSNSFQNRLCFYLLHCRFGSRLIERLGASEFPKGSFVLLWGILP